MEQTHRTHVRRVALIAAVCAMLLAMTAYAADWGGVQHAIQLWVHGEWKETTVTFTEAGHYDLCYEDGEGEEQHIYGGGVSIAPNGSERPATEEELLEHLQSPQVHYGEDGKVWVVWKGERREITDEFQDGICYVQLSDGAERLYMTVKYHGSYATSPHKYPDP